ncbi:fumarylacetoacetate hydrolase family protein [Paenibacillus mesophilus]|uniref:fumarylacetoacetate hydrolase family protein n=1 Tax=Paenibacillus mesophilus TaxID=2582849 RepID=UPI00110ED520|nr:fumarylacetoacetate hydrolase family protein [Paenibacillus mesophilus]TMV48473.1 fumarylacetoacetate hydrolase family protein [Paenibacillus mesophilus]
MTSFNDIRNIYCVGRNYGLHAAELGNAVPEQPMLFSKPTHSLIALDGGEIRLPGSRGEVHYEMEIVIRIGRPYEKGIRVDELVDGVALGIDFTLRDVQSELKKKGYPWLAAKGFRHSAPITAFRPFGGTEALGSKEFVLLKNGSEAQRGNANDMIFNLQTIVDFCAEHFGLGLGDAIFTGTPAGVGQVADGDRFVLQFGSETWGEGVVRLV